MRIDPSSSWKGGVGTFFVRRHGERLPALEGLRRRRGVEERHTGRDRKKIIEFVSRSKTFVALCPRGITFRLAR